MILEEIDEFVMVRVWRREERSLELVRRAEQKILKLQMTKMPFKGKDVIILR